jgi:predicted amidophosphoribosyltransferase
MPGKKPAKLKTPNVCPVCGEDVPHGALACPECGADHNSGWREDADVYGAVDLPDEQFNYEKFAREEFGSPFKPVG